VDSWELGLIRRVQTGEAEAFTPLVVRYGAPLRHVMGQILGDPDAAADVTQEAFIATY
jgi:DNA-directed RNA polymerase specialized sigma24 family protein